MPDPPVDVLPLQSASAPAPTPSAPIEIAVPAPAATQEPAPSPVPATQPVFKQDPDKMEIDQPPMLPAVSLSPGPSVEPEHMVADHEATTSAAEEAAHSPHIKTEKPQVAVDPHTPVPKSRARRGSRSKAESVAKRKADSDGEYQQDDDKHHQDKRHRRMSLMQGSEQVDRPHAKPQTPASELRRRSSAGAPKNAPTPKVKSAEDTAPQKELVKAIGELRNNTRKNVATYLVGILIDRARHLAFTEGTLSMNEGDTVEGLAEPLALLIEYHAYHCLNKTGDVTPEYTKKMRSIGFNAKANVALSDELLLGRLSAERLVGMTTEEMASKELKELTEKMRLESEKQHTLINTETGPRIRRTHKGEELVDDPKTTQNGQDTLLGTGTIVRRQTPDFSEKSPVPALQEKSPSAGPAVESPPTVGDKSETPKSPSAPAIRPPPIDTAKASEKNGRSFSLDNIWSHVESPDQDRLPRRPPAQTPVSTKPADNTFDKDVDLLLKDDHESGAGTPPYSPASFDDHYSPRADDEISDSWRGRIEMNAICNLSATATLLGGPEAIGDVPWHALLDSVLSIDGRIRYDRVTEYLCGQKYSRSSTMVIASVKPADSMNQTDFDRLYDYLRKKERYAVVGKHAQALIKDVYLAPVEAHGALPDWFNAVDSHQVPATGRSGKMLILIFVVNRSRVPGATPTPTMGQFPTPTPPQQFSPAPHPPPQQQKPFVAASVQQQLPQGFGTPAQQTSYGSPAPPAASPFVPPTPQAQGHLDQQHAYSPPPAYSVLPPVNAAAAAVTASVPAPPVPYQPQYTMTRNLQASLPNMTNEQLITVDRLLSERPELQNDVQRLALELGPYLAQAGVPLSS